MLADVARHLSCPHCRAPLNPADRALQCSAGHSFDIARQGYVNLLPAGKTRGTIQGDTAVMVAARAVFLAAGHYAPITDALVAAAGTVTAPGCVVDVGAGLGHHLAAVLDGVHGREGIALDVSTSAARTAARAHPRAGAVVGDVWRRLPVRDGAAAVVLDVFAPRDGAEIARVLHPDGSLVVVVPTPQHLGELVGALRLLSVDPRKEERLERTLYPHLQHVDTAGLEFAMELDHVAATALVGMGPSARHTDPEDLARRIGALPTPVRVTASVAIGTWRRGPS